VVAPVVGGVEQGWPVNGFVPVDRFRTAVGSAGETVRGWPPGTGILFPLSGVYGGWATVFPLRIGLVVFPLCIGLLVFCASDTAVVKVRTKTLRPTRSRRFAVMVDLPFGHPDTDQILAIF
jgi:hypothetical protein